MAAEPCDGAMAETAQSGIRVAERNGVTAKVGDHSKARVEATRSECSAAVALERSAVERARSADEALQVSAMT